MSIRSLWDKFDAATRDWLMGHPGCLIVPRTLAEAMNRALRPSTGGWNGFGRSPDPALSGWGTRRARQPAHKSAGRQGRRLFSRGGPVTGDGDLPALRGPRFGQR